MLFFTSSMMIEALFLIYNLAPTFNISVKNFQILYLYNPKIYVTIIQ